MKDFMICGHTLKELLPTLVKTGFVLGLILGSYLLLKF